MFVFKQIDTIQFPNHVSSDIECTIFCKSLYKFFIIDMNIPNILVMRILCTKNKF